VVNGTLKYFTQAAEVDAGLARENGHPDARGLRDLAPRFPGPLRPTDRPLRADATDLNVLSIEGHVACPRVEPKEQSGDAFGGPFAAGVNLLSLLSRKEKISTNDDPPSEFKFLSIGTDGKSGGLQKKMSDLLPGRLGRSREGHRLRRHRRTLTDLSDVRRQSLKGAALKNNDSDVPPGGFLTFANGLFPPGSFRANSGDMSVDLHNILVAVDSCGERRK